MNLVPMRQKKITCIVNPTMTIVNVLLKLGEASLMETGSNSSPSLSRLLCGPDGSEVIQLNSTDLSGLSNFLDSDKPDQLSDSLNRLSTSDLLPRTNL